MKTKSIFRAILLFILIMTSALFICSCSQDPEQTEIYEVTIKNNKQTVSLKAFLDDQYIEEHKGESVYLLALTTPYTVELDDSVIVLADAKVKEKLTFEFKLNDESQGTHLSRAFVLARKSSDADETDSEYIAITDAAYISNPDVLATNKVKPVDPSGIKGVSSDDVYEAAYLGAEHILLEAYINDILLYEYQPQAIHYVFDGVSYYFDEETVNRMDKAIKEANALGLRVYLRTALKYPATDKYGEYEKSPVLSLYCPKIKKGCSGYAVNMNDSEAFRYIQAFYSFLAARYSGDNGNVTDYIIGDRVNEYSSYCNTSYSKEEFEGIYHAWVRAASNTLRSINPSAEIYISISNVWREEGSSSNIGAQAFLERFATRSKSGGDFAWSVALNLGDGEDLSSLLSGEGWEYSTLGINNIKSFVDLMHSDALRHLEKERRYIIDGLALSEKTSEKNRAAYYAYSYYRAAELGFDAFIYSAREDESSLYSAGGNRSELYYAFLMCGSNMTTQLEGYVSKVKDAEMPNFAEYTSRKLKYEQTAKLELSSSVVKNRSEIPFELYELEAAGSAYNVRIKLNKDAESGDYYKTLLLESDSSKYIGAATVVGVPAKEVISSGYIGVTVSAADCGKIAIIVSNQQNSAAYVGETEVIDGEMTYYFNITDLTSEVKSSDALNVSVCILPDAEEDVSCVEIKDIALYGSSHKGARTVITVVIVAVSALALCAIMFLLARSRKRKLRSTHDQ